MRSEYILECVDEALEVARGPRSDGGSAAAI